MICTEWLRFCIVEYECITHLISAILVMAGVGFSYVYLTLPGISQSLNHNSYLHGPVDALERGSILILLMVQKSPANNGINYQPQLDGPKNLVNNGINLLPFPQRMLLNPDVFLPSTVGPNKQILTLTPDPGSCGRLVCLGGLHYRGFYSRVPFC